MTTGRMRRLSMPWTRLSCHVVPTALLVFFIVECGIQAWAAVRDGQWPFALLLFVFVGGFVVIWRRLFDTYDAWLCDDELVLRRPFSQMHLPIARLTSIEIPLDGLQLFPTVWVHWTDDARVRRTARFVARRSPEWFAFCQQLPTSLMPVKPR